MTPLGSLIGTAYRLRLLFGENLVFVQSRKSSFISIGVGGCVFVRKMSPMSEKVSGRARDEMRKIELFWGRVHTCWRKRWRTRLRFARLAGSFASHVDSTRLVFLSRSPKFRLSLSVFFLFCSSGSVTWA